jgi:hypothetical protein
MWAARPVRDDALVLGIWVGLMEVLSIGFCLPGVRLSVDQVGFLDFCGKITPMVLTYGRPETWIASTTGGCLIAQALSYPPTLRYHCLGLWARKTEGIVKLESF